MGSRRLVPCILLLPVLLAAQSPRVLAQATAAAVEFPSGEGQKLHFASIPNAGKISSQLYRGAQPRPGGLAELKKLGITTIVDLRGEDASLRNREKQEAESLGLRFVAIPVSGWTPPTNEQVAEFLSLFRNSGQERIFVHCRFGEDRTGAFVATYRMALQGWFPAGPRGRRPQPTQTPAGEPRIRPLSQETGVSRRRKPKYKITFQKET